MKLLPVFCASMFVASCQTAEPVRPRFAPVASLTTEQLWDVGHWHAATQQLSCDGIARHDAQQWLIQRYGAQERRITARLGEKNAPDIIPILPPCSHFRGAVDRYAESLRELENRLSEQ